jgi:hypothetical protein
MNPDVGGDKPHKSKAALLIAFLISGFWVLYILSGVKNLHLQRVVSKSF